LSELPWPGGDNGKSQGGRYSEHGALRNLSHAEKSKYRLLDVPQVAEGKMQKAN